MFESSTGTTGLADLSRITDNDLLDTVLALVQCCNRTTADLLVHLGEVDLRRLYAVLACSSMFEYCVARLGFSEASANKRIRASRVARRYPVVFHMVAEGQLHLSGISVLAAYLTDENHAELLTAASGKTRRAIEQLVADHFPKPTTKPQIRKLPQHPQPQHPQPAPMPAAAPAPGPAPAGTPAPDPAPVLNWPRGQSYDRNSTAGPAATASNPTPAPASDRAMGRSEPLGAQRYRVSFTAKAEFVDKLRQAQALMSHRVPDGDYAQVLDAALDLLNQQLRKERYGERSRPAKDPAAKDPAAKDPAAKDPAAKKRSRHIPHAVRRQVHARDGERCTFVDAFGRRCTQTRFLEFHHIQAFAMGGESTADNITLRCTTHNLHAAIHDYGAAHMEAKMRQKPLDFKGRSADGVLPGP